MLNEMPVNGRGAESSHGAGLAALEARDSCRLISSYADGVNKRGVPRLPIRLSSVR